MTFPTQIRERDGEAALVCGSDPPKLLITAQGVANAGREANASNAASESLLSLKDLPISINHHGSQQFIEGLN